MRIKIDRVDPHCWVSDDTPFMARCKFFRLRIDYGKISHRFYHRYVIYVWIDSLRIRNRPVFITKYLTNGLPNLLIHFGILRIKWLRWGMESC